MIRKITLLLTGVMLVLSSIVLASQSASASSFTCRITPNHSGTYSTWALARFDVSTGGSVRPTILQGATLPNPPSNAGTQIMGWELRATKTNGQDFKLWSGTQTVTADGGYRTLAVPASNYYLAPADGWDLSTVRWVVVEGDGVPNRIYVTQNSTNAATNPGCPPNPWA